MLDFNTFDNRLQVAISPVGEVESLKDKCFKWREKKNSSAKLARLYELAGMPDLALRSAWCSTSLGFAVSADGSKQLSAANFCHLRLCPICTGRRAHKAKWRLSKVLDLVEAEHDARYIFLTLTVANVDGPALGDALSTLTAAWNKLLQHRPVKRAVKGWFRAIEITRGDDRWHRDRRGRLVFKADNGYHPHIHAILAVAPEYFATSSGLYISHEEWMERWRQALQVSYEPSVRIQATKAKGEYKATKAAAEEAAKYAVKDADYIDDTQPQERQVGIVRDYTEALHGRRLTAFGGWLKQAARALKIENLEDGDLVHTDEDAVREDVAELYEVYGWSFGVGDYLLTSREPYALRNQDK